MNTNPYSKQRGAALELQNPRSTEAYALIEIAHRMEKVRTAQQVDEQDRQKLIDVYQLNLKLWTIFQSELASPENALPDEIKANMLQLANFIDTHTIEQMRAPTTRGLDVLININRQVGAGLMGDSGNAVEAEATQAQTQVQTQAQTQAPERPLAQAPAAQSPATRPAAGPAGNAPFEQTPTQRSLFRTHKVGTTRPRVQR